MGSSQSTSSASNSDSAILSLKLHRDTLTRLSPSLFTQQALLTQRAGKLLPSDKAGALAILRQRAKVAKEREGVLAALDKVEGMLSAIRQAQHSAALMGVLRNAQVVLRDVSGKYSVAQARELMSSIQDSRLNSEEMSQALRGEVHLDESEEEQLRVFQIELDMQKLHEAPDAADLELPVTAPESEQQGQISTVQEGRVALPA